MATENWRFLEPWSVFDHFPKSAVELELTKRLQLPSSKHVTAVIGRGGRNIKQIQKATNTDIETEDDDNSEAFLIHGWNQNDIDEAEELILESAKTVQKDSFSTSDETEVEEELDEDDDYEDEEEEGEEEEEENYDDDDSEWEDVDDEEGVSDNDGEEYEDNNSDQEEDDDDLDEHEDEGEDDVGSIKTQRVRVPSSDHAAKIIGIQGHNVRRIAKKTGAKIDSPDSDEQPIFDLEGTDDEIEETIKEFGIILKEFHKEKARDVVSKTVNIAYCTAVYCNLRCLSQDFRTKITLSLLSDKINKPLLRVIIYGYIDDVDAVMDEINKVSEKSGKNTKTTIASTFGSSAELAKFKEIFDVKQIENQTGVTITFPSKKRSTMTISGSVYSAAKALAEISIRAYILASNYGVSIGVGTDRLFQKFVIISNPQNAAVNELKTLQSQTSTAIITPTTGKAQVFILCGLKDSVQIAAVRLLALVGETASNVSIGNTQPKDRISNRPAKASHKNKPGLSAATSRHDSSTLDSLPDALATMTSKPSVAEFLGQLFGAVLTSISQQANESGNSDDPQASLQDADKKQPGNAKAVITEKIVVARHAVPFVIGNQANTITTIARKTKTSIKTPNRTGPPIFTITGKKKCIEDAKKEILEIAAKVSVVKEDNNTMKNQDDSEVAKGKRRRRHGKGFEANSAKQQVTKTSLKTPSDSRQKTATAKVKRHVVIDADNVCMAHGRNEFYSARGLELAVNYFEARGHQVLAVVPEEKIRCAPDSQVHRVEGQDILIRLEKTGNIVVVPRKKLANGSTVKPYADLLTVKYAFEEDGVIISNDNMIDVVEKNPQYKDAVESRRIMFTFALDKFMIIDDPNGRSGVHAVDLLTYEKESVQPDLVTF